MRIGEGRGDEAAARVELSRRLAVPPGSGQLAARSDRGDGVAFDKDVDGSG
jgi:hypothetical protein